MNKGDDYGQFSTNTLSDIQSCNNLVTVKKEIRKVRVSYWLCNFACLVHYRGFLPAVVVFGS